MKYIKKFNESILDNYYYAWKVDGKKAAALALGMGSLYNHSYNPNAEYTQNYKTDEISFISIKDIDADEDADAGGLVVEDERVIIPYSTMDKTTIIGVYDKKYIDSIVKYT